MAEEEKKGFLKSKAFLLIIVWLVLGAVLTVVLYNVRPSMKQACETWAEEMGHGGGHGEANIHGDEYHACHLVAVEGHGFKRNLASSFHAIASMPLATAWNIPNFLILFTLLWYFAKDGINESLKNKRQDLEKAIAEAGRALAEAEERHKEYEAKLSEIDSEIDKIRQEMREEGEAEKQKLIAEAKHQAERISTGAEFTARQELLMARYRLREEAAKLAVEIAEKVIKQTINDQDRDRLLDEYIGKVMEKQN